MRVLVLRAEPEASRTAAALVARGHSAHIDPLLRFIPLDAVRPDRPFDAVALTSVRAARRAAELRWPLEPRVPAYVVGARTAAAASEAGFAEVVAADGSVADLARLLTERLIPRQRVLWLAGADRAGDLAVLVAPAKIAVDLAIVYRAEAVAEFAAETLAALEAGEVDGVLHYSRRTCETFLVAARRGGVYQQIASLPHYALSPRVAAPLAELGAEVRVAATADEANLLDLLDN